MAPVSLPTQLLRQLYSFGTSSNVPDGVSFELENRLLDASVIALAGELSLGAAISSLDWVSSHEALGRNR